MTILHAGCGHRLNKVMISGVLPWAQDRKGLPEGPFQLRPECVSRDEVGVRWGLPSRWRGMATTENWK